MGTYLSTPVLDKHTEKGADLDDTTPCRWAVVDMQGWRKSMEDAHVARTDVRLPCCISSPENGNDGGGGGAATKAKVFAVFDGHGGAEVARFCQMNLVPVLTSQDAWKNIRIATNNNVPSDFAAADSYDGTYSAAQKKLDDNNLEAKEIGQALIDAFHALDRLIDDPKCREDIDRWRMERPPPYESEEQEGGNQERDEEQTETTKGNVEVELQPIPDGEKVQTRRHTAMDPNELAKSAAAVNLLQEVIADDNEKKEKAGKYEMDEPSETENDDFENKDTDGIVHDDSDDDERVEVNNTNENDDGEIADKTNYERGTMTMSSSDAVALFQKLLHLNVTEDDDSDDEEDEEGNSEDSKLNGYPKASGEAQDSEQVLIPTKEQLLNPPTGIVAPSAAVPTKIQNGRKVSLRYSPHHLLLIDLFNNIFFVYFLHRSVIFLTILYTQDVHPLWLSLWDVPL